MLFAFLKPERAESPGNPLDDFPPSPQARPAMASGHGEPASRPSSPASDLEQPFGLAAHEPDQLPPVLDLSKEELLLP